MRMFEERVKKLNGGGNNKKSYTVAEVQQILGVGRQAVYKLIKKGCFKAVSYTHLDVYKRQQRIFLTLLKHLTRL